MKNRVPLGTEIPIFEVDDSLANHLVREDVVMVPQLNLQEAGSWQIRVEIENSKKLWIGCVFQVILNIVDDFLPKLESKIGI